MHPSDIAVETLTWALDLIDMYDERLVQLGDPREVVYSATHSAMKQRLRANLARLTAPALPLTPAEYEFGAALMHYEEMVQKHPNGGEEFGKARRRVLDLFRFSPRASASPLSEKDVALVNELRYSAARAKVNVVLEVSEAAALCDLIARLSASAPSPEDAPKRQAAGFLTDADIASLPEWK